jgi:hypothetical protein
MVEVCSTGIELRRQEMPKPTCQLNLTLDVPTAEWVERIARDVNLRPSGCGRVLLEQRLALEARGWRIDDKEMGTVLEAICSLKNKDLEAVKDLLRKLVSGSSREAAQG